MDLYLVRHTTPDIAKGICYGQSDIGVAANFNEESDTILRKIPNATLCNVYTSPLKRCTQLAKKISHTIMEDPRLMELYFGDWELKAWNDIPEKDIRPWMTDFVNVATPNGESYVALHHRVWACVSYITALTTTHPIVIVCHAGPIRAILSKILNIGLKDSFKIPVNYGDVFQLKFEEGTLKLVSDIQF